jgi:prepilin-type N-terminal cleavage/methylation domain-containing protein
MNKSIKYNGFTLIELLVVLAILTSISSIALLSVGNNLNQQRFDDTKRKIQTIKHAIIGYPERTVNNKPDISGFIADIGRLPNCLAELLNKDIDANICDPNIDNDNNPITNPHITAPTHTYNSVTGLWHGWQGPYIDVISDLDGSHRYRDGWGGESNIINQDNANFGWTHTILAAGDLIIQSKGLDNIQNPDTQTQYNELDIFEKDFPATTASGVTGVYTDNPIPVITANDYQHELTNITVRFFNTDGSLSKPTLANQNLCVVLSYVADGAITQVATGVNTIFQNTVGSNTSVAVNFSLPSTTITVGHVAIEVKQENAGSCGTTTGVSYGPFSAAQVITISSRSTPPIIQWTMQ